MNKNLLIIEDNEDIVLSLKAILEEEGYGIAWANNGQTALDHLQTAATLPSLILLDLMMPVMDGFEFRQHQLKNAQYASIPVIIMSADGRVEEKLAKTSAAAYVKKPYDLEELLNLIESLSS